MSLNQSKHIQELVHAEISVLINSIFVHSENSIA